MIFSLVAFIALSIMAWPSLAQSFTVSNASSEVVSFKLKGESAPRTLSPGASLNANYTAPSNGAEVYLTVLRNGSITPLGYFSKPLSGGKLIINDADLKRKGEKSFDDLKSSSPRQAPTATIATDNRSYVPSSGGNGPTQPMTLTNGSTHRFEILSPPFEGAALKPGQTSIRIFNVPTGLLQVTAFVDKDTDSTSTGRNYMQAVISGIVAEGEKSLTIKDENILIGTGSRVKISLFSHLAFKCYVVGGPFSGASLSPGKYWTKRVDVSYGFNSMSIQYFQGGLKYQANIELIITPNDRILKIFPDDIKNAKVIER